MSKFRQNMENLKTLLTEAVRAETFGESTALVRQAQNFLTEKMKETDAQVSRMKELGYLVSEEMPNISQVEAHARLMEQQKHNRRINTILSIMGDNVDYDADITEGGFRTLAIHIEKFCDFADRYQVEYLKSKGFDAKLLDSGVFTGFPDVSPVGGQQGSNN